MRKKIILRRKVKKGKCQFTESCQNTAVYKDCCSACYQWWKRVQLLTVGELIMYRKRIVRMQGRVADNYNTLMRRAK